MKNKPAPPQPPVQVQAAPVVFNDNQQHLLLLAQETYNAGLAFADKFRNMVRFARENNMSPVEVRQVLTAAGFGPTRVSEMTTLSQMPNEVWTEYDQKQIGWRPALEKAREAKSASTGKGGKPRGPTLGQISASVITAHAKATRRAKNSKMKFARVNDGNLLICCPLKTGETKFDLNLYQVEVRVTEKPAKASREPAK